MSTIEERLRRRAKAKGRAAYQSCTPRSENPYRAAETRHWWEAGWDEVEAEIMKQRVRTMAEFRER